MTDKNHRTGAKQIGKQIFICSTDNIDLYPLGEAKLLPLLGVKGALLTDFSTVSDFNYDDAMLAALTEATGIEVTPRTNLWELAQALEPKQ